MNKHLMTDARNLLIEEIFLCRELRIHLGYCFVTSMLKVLSSRFIVPARRASQAEQTKGANSERLPIN
ncbi:MAG TPA: hypothetical protein VNI84_04995 [Pyrinomonadaceae bacterium]|nr:hypothetical protein [Pyrinomonadaceae bacterium]